MIIRTALNIERMNETNLNKIFVLHVILAYILSYEILAPIKYKCWYIFTSICFMQLAR